MNGEHTSTTVSREWQAFWLAVGFLTRIPMLAQIDYSQKLMNQCSLYFPVVGLLLGVLYAALFALLGLAWNPLVCVLLVLCFHLFITGAFHEDGLADSVDALGGGYTVEKRLAIMKDSRIGTYGTVALVLALGLKVALLMDAKNIGLALLIAPAVSRLTPLLLMAYMPYVTDPDTSKSKPVAEAFSRHRLLVSVLFTALVSLAFSLWVPGLWLAALTATIAVALLWGGYLQRQLGGYTGDALGASVVFSELVFLMML
ncbi:adenosylcobinamide-GDP ribazoletransferase [Marinobacter adhaerens]|uniref:Adenosylcobinamide-GDP ribazoletransferase n=1 Tax=Marinobacter adhaerens TaxID=1033846 RepID=A0A851HSJ5_9GAMM|nr:MULTISPECIES: adenosylcobinamide-GDP ribazoletransferase [Marinobacter]NWN91947.1 adenosylcobinamide-GDP ribazoletransferase [Marinobacter adhaerens]